MRFIFLKKTIDRWVSRWSLLGAVGGALVFSASAFDADKAVQPDPASPTLDRDCVPTVLRLKAIKQPARFPCVYVLGYYYPDDGGGGHFWFDPTETAQENGGTIIRPNAISPASPGRFIRLRNEQNWLSVKWFGAKGDGSFDDTPAIQAAIKAVPDTGGVVYFPTPSGQYRAENLQLKSNLTLLGECSGKNDVTTKGIKGKNANTVFKTGAYPGGDNKQNRNIMIAGLYVENEDHPCLELSHASNFTLRDCIFRSKAANAIKARFSYRGLIDNCFIATSGLDIDRSFALTLFDNCNTVTVSNCTITGGSAGSGVDITESQRISVKHCTFEVIEGWGIRIGGNASFPGNCHGFEVDNNYFEQVKRPISIGAWSLCTGGSVENNYSNNRQAKGTAVQYGILLGRCFGVAVTNNSFFGDSIEAFINFAYRVDGGASFFTDGAIEQNYTETFAVDYAFDATFTNLGHSANVFGQSRISFMQKPPTGVVKSYVTDKYAANQAVPHTAVIPATTEGGRLDRIDVVDATGTVDAVLYVGTKTAYNELIDGKALNKLTYNFGTAEVGPISNSGLIRRGEPVRIYIAAGNGAGTYRLKFTYRN